MSTPDHCLRCGLAFNVRHCTPGGCHNPEGVVEVERLRAEQAAMTEKPWEAVMLKPTPNPTAEAAMGKLRAIMAAAPDALGPLPDRGFSAAGARLPSDLDTFRAMLERAGVRFTFGETLGGSAVAADGADFYFDEAGKLIRVGD